MEPKTAAQNQANIQFVYDQAHKRGILEEPLTYDPSSGVIAARIEDGKLIETVAGQPDRVR